MPHNSVVILQEKLPCEANINKVWWLRIQNDTVLVFIVLVMLTVTERVMTKIDWDLEVRDQDQDSFWHKTETARPRLRIFSQNGDVRLLVQNQDLTYLSETETFWNYN